MKLGAVLIMNAVLICAIPGWPQMQSLGAKDTFVASRLSAKEIHQVVEEVEQSAYDTPDSWQNELRVKRVDLGASTGIMVRGSDLLCGGTGNCQTWVFRKTNDKLVSLFPKDHVPIAESFRLGPHMTAGVKDFSIFANSSAEGGQTVTYKFDGKFYRAK
jgi:hypothetical protein